MDSYYQKKYFPRHEKEKNNLSAIKKLKYVKGEIIKRETSEGEIISILEGCISFPQDFSQEYVIKEGELIFLSPATCYEFIAKEDSLLLFFRLEEQISLISQHLLEELPNEDLQKKGNFSFLPMKIQVLNYMKSLSDYLDDGICEEHFYEVKIMELYFLLKRYYSRQEIIGFLSPISSPNAHFTHFVFKNYAKVKTAKELAEMANLSFSSFEKEFKKVFKSSPYQWMKQKKTKNLFNEIRYGRKPLKVISEELGFSSPSQMNDFCKKEFGMTPGKIREEQVQ